MGYTNMLGRRRRGSTFSPEPWGGGGSRRPPGGTTTSPTGPGRGGRVPDTSGGTLDTKRGPMGYDPTIFDETPYLPENWGTGEDEARRMWRLWYLRAGRDLAQLPGIIADFTVQHGWELTPWGRIKEINDIWREVVIYISTPPVSIPGGYNLAESGWTMCCGPSSNPQWVRTDFSNSSSNCGSAGTLCGLGNQALGARSNAYGDPIDAASTGRRIFIGPLNVPQTRFTIEEYWTIPANVPRVLPEWQPGTETQAVYGWMIPGQIHPMWITPNPNVKPKPQLQPKYRRMPKAWNKPKPYQIPSLRVDTNGGRGPALHNRVPPKYPTKEKKGAISFPGDWIGGWAEWFVATTTETAEIIGIVHDALPEKYQCGGCTPIRQSQIVWQHADKIDIVTLAENIVFNYVEDKVIGTLADRGKYLARKGGWGAGPGLGPAM